MTSRLPGTRHTGIGAWRSMIKGDLFLAFDLDMRRQYHHLPFQFIESTWESKLNRFIQMQQNMHSYPSAALSSCTQADCGSEKKKGRVRSMSPPSKSNNITSLGSRFRLPFQGRWSKTLALAICLICTRAWHTINNCTYHRFKDGLPVITKVSKGLFYLINDKLKYMCINSNIRGKPEQECNRHRTGTVHICSFCGSQITTCSPSPAREDNNEDLKDPPLVLPLPPPFPHANFPSCPDLLFKICMPYNPEAVEIFLQLYPELEPQFSTLPEKLRKGFNMGDFLPLQQTIIWPNKKSVIEHEAYLEEYCKEEGMKVAWVGPSCSKKWKIFAAATFTLLQFQWWSQRERKEADMHQSLKGHRRAPLSELILWPKEISHLLRHGSLNGRNCKFFILRPPWLSSSCLYIFILMSGFGLPSCLTLSLTSSHSLVILLFDPNLVFLLTLALSFSLALSLQWLYDILFLFLLMHSHFLVCTSHHSGLKAHTLFYSIPTKLW